MMDKLERLGICANKSKLCIGFEDLFYIWAFRVCLDYEKEVLWIVILIVVIKGV